MKTLFAFVILLGVVGCLFAQTAPDTLWVKKYGSSGMDGATGILQNSDGGFTILGTTTTRGAGGIDIMLIRTTAMGDAMWTRTYGGTGNDNSADFATTTDGGFIIVASSTSMNDGHTHPYCLRVNAQGDTLWTRFLLTVPDGNYESICRAGNGYLMLANANADVFLQKIDVNGNTIWSRFLGVGGYAHQIRATTDSGFVTSGRMGYPMQVMKMDSVGNVLWHRGFGGGQSIGAAATSDGGVVVTGDGYGYFTGDRFDAAGNHVWSQIYSGYYTNGYCVVQAHDGSFVFGGYCNPNAEWSGVPCLYKTNTSGNVVWSDPFPYLYRGIIYRGIVTRDHGYAFIGWTNVDGNPQAFLITMASDPSNVPPPSTGFVQLVTSGPPNWDYRLNWTSGAISHFAFTNFCPGTIGSVSGNAASVGWTATNYPDSIVLSSPMPLTSGSIELLTLSHPWCSDVVTWTVGDSSNVVDGPLPLELTNFDATTVAQCIRISYATASETDNDHFEIWRGTAQDGPFAKITTIPSQGSSATGHRYEYLDSDVTTGLTYWYFLVDVDLAGNRTEHRNMMRSATAGGSEAIAGEYALTTYPNPFNPSTTISFSLLSGGSVRLDVYDVSGRFIRTLVNDEFPSGKHEVTFDAHDLPTGIYFARVESGSFTASRKMLLLK